MLTSNSKAFNFRIETIINSDLIICLKEGKIAEFGTHEQLLELNGVYAELIISQAEKQKKEAQKAQKFSPLHQIEADPEEEDVEDAEDDEMNEEDEKRMNGDISNPIFSEQINHNQNSNFYFKVDISNHVIEMDNILIKEKPVPIEVDRKLSARRKVTTPKSDRKLSRKFEKLESNATKAVEITKQKEEDTVDPTYFSESRKRLLNMLKTEKFFVIGAACAAACNGAVWPIYGILLADASAALSDKDLQNVLTGGRDVALMFVGLAIAAGIILWMQKYQFLILVTFFTELVKF